MNPCDDHASLIKVGPGDQLFAILRKHYGEGKFLEDKAQMIESVRFNNPEIKDIDLIYPGQKICLPKMSAAKSEIPKLSREGIAKSNEVKNEFNGINSFGELLISEINEEFNERTTLEYAIDGAGAIYESFSNKAQKAIKNLDELDDIYRKYKAHKLPKSTYGDKRVRILNKMDDNLGIFRSQAFQNKPTHRVAPTREIMRFSTSGKGKSASMLRATKNLQNAASRVSMLRGGGALLIAGAGMGAYEYGQAETDEERVAVVAETGGSIVGSVGMALMAAAMFTPAGWVGLAGVAAVGMAGGFVGSAAASAIADGTMYDENGKSKYDMLSYGEMWDGVKSRFSW